MKKINILSVSIISILLLNIGSMNNTQATLNEQISQYETKIEQLNQRISSLEDNNSELESMNAQLQNELVTSKTSGLLEQAQSHYNNQEYQQAKEIADSICSEYPNTDASNQASLISTEAQTQLDIIEQQRIEEEQRLEVERLLQEQQQQALLAEQQTQQVQSEASYEAPVENMVYIAASGNGNKYHNNPNCSRMKGTISLSVSAAQARGYEPCKKCY